MKNTDARVFLLKEDQLRKIVIKKKYRYEHSADGCTIMPRMEEFASAWRKYLEIYQ